MRKGSTSWLNLAVANDLCFIPGKFPHGRAKMVGRYRGYHLQLTRWTFGIEIILAAEKEPSHMRCKIAPACELSENTLKILGRMFGSVEQRTLL